MTRLLISGASGFVGRRLVQQLRDIASYHYQVSGTYHNHLPPDEGCHWYPADLTDQDQVGQLFQQTKPSVVVHLAAISDVVECERTPSQTTAVNVQGTEHIAKLCAQYNARLVFLSTDYVFSGDRGRYREDETPLPVTHYGKTKWEAEQAIAHHLAQWSVLRTSLMYGWPQPGDHGNLASTVLCCLESGHPFYGYTNMYRSPTYVEDVVRGIVRLAEGDYSGVYHVAGVDWVNMYDFALAVAEVFHLDRQLVTPALAPSPDSKDWRPKLLGLDCTGTPERLGISVPGVGSGLRQMRDDRRDRS